MLELYIDQISQRVNGLGGNATAIPPSLLGYRPLHHPIPRRCEGEVEEVEGKIGEVIFDCHGDFTGFILEGCCKRHIFESREKPIGELVLRALKERLAPVVWVDRARPRRPLSFLTTRGNGASARSRTWNLLIRSQMPYPVWPHPQRGQV